MDEQTKGHAKKIKSVVYGGGSRIEDSNMQTRGRGRVLSFSIERRLHLWPQQHSLQMEAEAT